MKWPNVRKGAFIRLTLSGRGTRRIRVSRKHRPQTSDLENPDLENTVLENPDLESTDQENTDLENTDLENSRPRNLKQVLLKTYTFDENSLLMARIFPIVYGYWRADLCFFLVV